MASSSSSSPSASAFSSQVWKYHVFLSFRGEDTRKTFVDHLYTALVQKGIYTYKDEETLPWGESIGQSLVTAIEESQIDIIIFSKSYADSSWCLDELVHIMKCKDTRGQIEMPIFYGIDPSEVRKQKRKYGKAFVKHKLENNKKVESWRKALANASNISGWEIQHMANGHEVWKMEDVREIFAMDAMMNLDKIEAITFKWLRSDEMQRGLQVAANMKNLQWIKVEDMTLLRFIIMPNFCPQRQLFCLTLPENFPPRQLSCLTLPGLKAKQLWEGCK
ncbi:hypothetical protein L1887_15448 [Cichorium endivia]|nr:hypothetical protein L1887_15448 [Cichorium endivia]